MRILFLPALSGKPWNGLTPLTQPLGGSEAAVAGLAGALSSLGHKVEVITHGEPCTDPFGVVYRQQDYNGCIHREWDAVVSSRWPEALEWPWKTALRALWLHDLPNGTLTARADEIVALTQFHASYFQSPGVKLHVIGDGYDHTLLKYQPYTPLHERNINKLMWVSNPDRGLCLAAKIFQELRQRWPDLELHVYGRAGVYGWGAEAERPFWPRREHRQNVIIHEPISRSALFKELATARAVFYPTYWPETYCMATLEAQAVGTPVIASPFGALVETVKGGILSYDFLNAMSQLRNARRWEKLSHDGLEWAKENTWVRVAERWEKEVLHV